MSIHIIITFLFNIFFLSPKHMRIYSNMYKGRCHTCESFKYLLNFTHGCSQKLWVSHYTSTALQSSSRHEHKVGSNELSTGKALICYMCFLLFCSTSTTGQMNVLQLSPHLTIKIKLFFYNRRFLASLSLKIFGNI